MLRFEILSEEQMRDIEFLHKSVCFLTTREIEDEFINMMSLMQETYEGELYNKALRAVEHGAERTSKFAVKTFEGEKCIACISTEAKFALLAILYAQEYSSMRFIINPAVLKDEVFVWLNYYLDITMYIPYRIMLQNPRFSLSSEHGLEFTWKGKVIDDLYQWVLGHDKKTAQ